MDGKVAEDLALACKEWRKQLADAPLSPAKCQKPAKLAVITTYFLGDEEFEDERHEMIECYEDSIDFAELKKLINVSWVFRGPEKGRLVEEPRGRSMEREMKFGDNADMKRKMG